MSAAELRSWNAEQLRLARVVSTAQRLPLLEAITLIAPLYRRMRRAP